MFCQRVCTLFSGTPLYTKAEDGMIKFTLEITLCKESGGWNIRGEARSRCIGELSRTQCHSFFILRNSLQKTLKLFTLAPLIVTM